MNYWIEIISALGIGSLTTMLARAFIDRKKIVEEVGTQAAQRIEKEIAILSDISEQNRQRMVEMYEREIEVFKTQMAKKDVECAKEIEKLKKGYNELKLKYNEVLQQMVKEAKK
jgi:phage terminase Nu1 subunit (DNA packaging protein)